MTNGNIYSIVKLSTFKKGIMKKYIPIYYDLMAKYIFGTEENKLFLAKILELLLDKETNSLKDLRISNSIALNKENIINKDFLTDILVELPNNRVLNVEFYSNYNKSSEIKSVMYISRLFSSNLKKGEPYIKAAPHIQINFIKNNYLHNSLNAVNKYMLVNVDDTRDCMIPDKLIIYNINLDFKAKKPYNLSELERWIKFIGSDKKEERIALAKGDELMEKALKKAEDFQNKDYVLDYFKDFSLYESSILEERMEKERERKENKIAIDRVNKEKEIAIDKVKKEKKIALNKAKKETEVALKENTISIAVSMLKDNVDINTIAKYTKLSLDQIKNLSLNRFLNIEG